jgi:anti-anti-sigma factor
MGTSFAVVTNERAGSVVIEAKGELDMAVVDEFRAAFTSVDWTTPRVLVDLTGLTFMDSLGISALVEANGKLRAEGIGWDLVVSRGAVLRVLEVTGLLEPLAVRVVD